jgi:hypothetical protein
VLYAVIMSSVDLRLLSYLLGKWPYVCIICVCVRLLLLSVEDLFVNSSQTGLPLTRAPSTHTNR